jgi:hypothetical protein
MDLSSPLTWFLAVPLAILIALVAGPFILQAACALCNIEDLGYFKALLLILLLVLINAPIGLGLFLAGQSLGSAGGWSKDALLGTALALGYPLHWLVSGLVLFWPLHVTYLKGVVVAIMHNVISLVVGGVLGGLILVGLALVQLCIGST